MKEILTMKAGGKALASDRLFRLMLALIVKSVEQGPTILICSAVEGVTRLLIKLAHAKTHKARKEFLDEFQRIHAEIISHLFPDPSEVLALLSRHIEELKTQVYDYAGDDTDARYAAILQYGELVSSLIMHEYLRSMNIRNSSLDARLCVRTEGPYSRASIVLDDSKKEIQEAVSRLMETTDLVIMPGFIGSDHRTAKNTILDLDGSDISAICTGAAVNSSEVILWKDTLICKHIPMPNNINNIHEFLSYDEFEKIFAEAPKSPIHLNTIAIAKKEHIRIRVKNFNQPDVPGSVIGPHVNLIEHIV